MQLEHLPWILLSPKITGTFSDAFHCFSICFQFFNFLGGFDLYSSNFQVACPVYIYILYIFKLRL